MKRRHFATAAIVVAVTGVGSYIYEDVTVPDTNPQNANDPTRWTSPSTNAIQLYSSSIGNFGLGTADACSGASCPAPTPAPTPKPTPKPTPTPTSASSPTSAPVSGGAPNSPVTGPGQTSTSGQTSGSNQTSGSTGMSSTDQTGSTPTTSTSLSANPTPGPGGGGGGDVATTLNPASPESSNFQPISKTTLTAFAAQFITRPVVIGAYILLGLVTLWTAAWLGRSLQGFAQPKNMKFIKIIVGISLVLSVAALVWLITVGLL